MTVATTDKERQEWYEHCLRGLGCCNHAPDFDPDGVAEVLHAGGYDGDCAEGESWFIARMKDGTFAVGEQSEDTSGHG